MRRNTIVLKKMRKENVRKKKKRTVNWSPIIQIKQ